MNQTVHQASDQWTGLVEKIKNHFPHLSVSSEGFPSGNRFLDIDTGNGFVVLEYSQGRQQYGVSKVTSPEDGFLGHDWVFDNFADAEARVLALLS